MKTKEAFGPAAASKIAELERTIREFNEAASELERQVKSEEARTKISDTSDAGYSSFARSAQERRDKLRASVDRLVRERDECIEQAATESGKKPH
jgi:flagellar protein FliJ